MSEKSKKVTKKSKKPSEKMYYQGELRFLAQRVFQIISDNKFLMSTEIIKKLSPSSKSQPTTYRINKILEQFKEYDYVKEYGIITGPMHQCDSKSKQYFFEIDKKKRMLEIIQKNASIKKRQTNEKTKLKKIKCLLVCKFCEKTILVELRKNSKIRRERLWDLSFNGILVAITFLKDERSWDLIKNSNNEILKLAKVLLENQKKQYVVILQKCLRKIVKEEPNLIPIAELWHKEMLEKIPKFRINNDIHPELVKYQQELELQQQRETMMTNRSGHFFRKLG